MATESGRDEENKQSPTDVDDYRFDERGKLVDSEGRPFIFTTQIEYEKLGERLTDLIYELLQQPPYSMTNVALDDCTSHSEQDEDVPSPPVNPDQSFVFISPNFRNATQLVVLVHGSGQVRAGQWSRKLIINDSLDSGSQLPYIAECLKRGWAVLVTNTNDNHYCALDPDGDTDVDRKGNARKRKKNSSTPEEHGLYVWRYLVSPMDHFDRIAIVAHSYGGVVTASILASLNSYNEWKRIKCVCLTDAIFGDKGAKEVQTRGVRIRNWVCSPQPLDTEIGDGEWKVSAGTKEHERSSHSSICSIIAYIEESFSTSIERAATL